jgi:crotonobetainyl-CoA:carnitine CoA-transferase CaiB-like acyl-CoA transferase
VSVSTPLIDIQVCEIGERIAVGTCGSLLAQLGAGVVLVEPRQPLTTHKWRSRPLFAAGKRSITTDAASAEDTALLRRMRHDADVVLLSSDVTTAPDDPLGRDQIMCDITAFGDSGPLSGLGYSDAMVQAVSGIVDTTGDSAQAPVPVGFPILEFCAGIYAAAAIIAALRVRRQHGCGQAIDIALFDCAMSTMSTFLPFHMIGKPVTRAGNRHSLAAPWNAYRAADGWVLICTATDEQWQRLCAAMGEPALAHDDAYATNAGRVMRSSEIDRRIQQWVMTGSVARCVECLCAINVPCGPISTVAQLADEPNLKHRHMIHHLVDPVANRRITLPGSPFRASRCAARVPTQIPLPGADQNAAARVRTGQPPSPAAPNAASALPQPLAGLRVIEIGQYTTAPLVARQLGALGAEVLKIEPPAGDGSRAWPPLQGDQGYFFTFSNSDKRSVMLDLRNTRDRAQFAELLKTADVLVENLKPGSLARLGFGAEALATDFPRLVYCGVSGFGADSAYPERPAFDTVVQAMSGIMDLTRTDNTPTKAGISAADVVGGEYSLLAILAALEYRDRTGQGQSIDISMQDVASWVTQTAWNDATKDDTPGVVACSDGYALTADNVTALADQLAKLDARFGGGLAVTRNLTRAEFIALAARAGIGAAPILSVAQAATSAQAIARQLIVYAVDANGIRRPLLNSPMRLKTTPPRVTRPIGKLGEANSETAAMPTSRPNLD